MNLKRNALLAVLDGPEPRTWEPWGFSFEKLSQKAETADLNLPPSPYRETGDFRLSVMLDSRDNLFTREDWTRVVGAIVESGEGSQEIKDGFTLLCTKLQVNGRAWFRRYGFYVAAVLPAAPSSEQLEFWHHLKVTAAYYLGDDRVRIVPIVEAAQFLFILPEFTRALIFELEKELRSTLTRR